jgi:hypothetical protein
MEATSTTETLVIHIPICTASHLTKEKKSYLDLPAIWLPHSILSQHGHEQFCSKRRPLEMMSFITSPTLHGHCKCHVQRRVIQQGGKGRGGGGEMHEWCHCFDYNASNSIEFKYRPKKKSIEMSVCLSVCLSVFSPSMVLHASSCNVVGFWRHTE